MCNQLRNTGVLSCLLVLQLDLEFISEYMHFEKIVCLKLFPLNGIYCSKHYMIFLKITEVLNQICSIFPFKFFIYSCKYFMVLDFNSNGDLVWLCNSVSAGLSRKTYFCLKKTRVLYEVYSNVFETEVKMSQLFKWNSYLSNFYKILCAAFPTRAPDFVLQNLERNWRSWKI